MHYAAANKWHSFFRDAIVKKVAITWYASFLQLYFDLDLKPAVKLGRQWFYDISRFENKRTKAQF